MKFATKLTALELLIVLLFILPFSFLAYTSSVETLEKNIALRLEDNALHIMDKIDRMLFERYADIKAFAGDSIISSEGSSPETIRKRLTAFRNYYKTYISISLFDTDRVRITDTAGIDIGKQHPLEIYWKKNQVFENFVMDVSISNALKCAVMHFAYPVKNKKGESTGVLVSRMPVSKLNQVVKSAVGIQSELKELNIDLVDKEGLLLYSNYNRRGILKDVVDLPGCAQKPLNGEVSSVMLCRHKDRGKEIGVFVRERGYLDFKGNGWTLILHIPEKIVFAPAYQLKNRLLIMACSLLFISIIVALLFSRSILKPVSKLVKGVEIIGTGNFDYRIETSSEDEIGRLSKSFDKMTQDLKKTTASRKELNEEIKERRKTEIQLQAERDRFKTILETNPSGIYIVDQQYNIEYINPVIEKEFGSVNGQKCYEYFHDRTESCPWCKNDEVFAGKSVRWEWFSEKNNKYYDLFDTPIKSPDGTILKFEVFHDITERKKSEDALIAAETKYRIVADFTYDWESWEASDGKFIYVSPACEKISGYKVQEFYDNQNLLYEIIFPEDQKIWDDHREKLHTDPGLGEVQFRIYAKDGSIHWIGHVCTEVIDNGKSLGIRGSNRDITARKQAEETLRKSEERFLKIYELGLIGMAVTSPEKGWVQVNQRLCEILGYPQEELKQKTWADITLPEDLDKDIGYFEKVLAGEIDGYSIEKRFIKKDGSIVYASISVKCIRNTDGTANHFLALIDDITKRKRAEEELYRAKEDLKVRNEISNIFLITPDDEIYGELLQVVLKTLKSPYGTFAYIDENGDRVVPSMTRDIWDECKMSNKSLFFPRKEWKDTLWANCILEKRTLAAKDPFRTPKGHITITRAVATPIIHRGEVIGNLMVGNKASDYDENDIQSLEFIAGHTAPILYARLQKDKEEQKRKKAEKALQESELFNRSSLENSPVCTKMVDLDLNLQYMSSAGIQGLGIEDITPYYGKPYPFDFYPESFRKTMTENLEKAGKTGEIVTQEAAVLDLEENEVWLHSTIVPVKNEKGQIEYFLVVSADTTERKKAEKEHIQLTTAIEQATEIVIITNLEGIIEYANPAFEEITGYSAKYAVGQKTSFLKSGKQDDLFYRELWTTISRGDVWQGHFINKKKGGSFYDEEATITPVKNSAGDIINFVAIKRDVTNEIKMEEQLRQAQKMEAIGTLSGGIAHDFNNILSALIGYTELGLEDVADRPETYDSLQQVLISAGRAKDLVSQILTFSRSSQAEKKPIKAKLIVKEVCKFLRSSLPSSIEIRQNLTAEKDIILADTTQFHQVLMNLCTNAGYAMKDNGGVLEVTLENIFLNEKDLPGKKLIKTGPHLKLTVKDSGAGIKKEDLTRIFDPYYTSKEKGEGTGLGLAVVHGIVEDHMGNIQVVSKFGSGSIFTVLIPLLNGVVTEESSPDKKSLPLGTETILLVDDEETLVHVTKMTLNRFGYKVITALNGDDALETFGFARDAYDLVITDRTMPGMNGYELTLELRKIRPDIPVIMCSGFDEKEDKINRDKNNINAFISKPLDKKRLALIVRRVLDEKTI